MKIKLSPYMQYQSSVWILVVVLFIYGSVMTYFSLRNIPSIQIIAIEATGTRLITDSKDKVFEKENQEFVKRFLRYYTNYDWENFSETLGKSTDWLSEAAWARIKESFNQTKAQILEMRMVQISEITKLEQSDSNPLDFTALITTRQIYRGSSKRITGKIHLRIKPKKRSELNPWGQEVEEIDETWKEGT